MKGSELYDLDIKMFSNDQYAELKFGNGGIRVLATK